MVQLANFLADRLDHAVIDKTELKGRYAVKLAWEQDPSVPESAVPESDMIFSAVERDLGLKLEPHRDRVETLVIESAEKPSPN